MIKVFEHNGFMDFKKLLTPVNIVVAAVVVIALLVGGYFLMSNNNPSSTSEEMSTEESMTEESTMEGDVKTVNLSAQNDSGQSGTVTFTASGTQTNVVINLDVPSDVPQPAHIHSGACPTPGDIVYPLTDVVDGSSETVLDVELTALTAELPLAVNVHKSAEEVSVYTSCGDL